MKPITLLLTILVLVSCNKDDENTSTDRNFKFEFTAASGWTLVNEQGEDTYVGYYQKEDYKINFDYGRLAFDKIDSIYNTSDLLYYEELIIDGSRAKITKEDRIDGIRLSAYIDKGDGENKNRIYTFNTSNDQIFINMVKSHKFK
ncbi:hypothetical protein [Marixanthomonas ophiurae]|uniref:Lipoprotein n=1 Tax=Marixanthomonas ophiurae TaxID=387659 RepID=A0A3E1Q7Q5_9FLAO|nr:hypothetical protein [Marixanthomonas ophiurae]RFN58165.1 hypothetical protein DZ858_13100 [Marixanthomonas ophiurae]